MIQFFLGTIFGGIIGVTVMCLMTAAKWGDRND